MTTTHLSLPPQKSTRDNIADALRKAVFAGELIAGQRIIERDLAERLGTSRAPVREALRQLEQEGFVESMSYRGTRVATITEVEVREVLLPIRIDLEKFALDHFMEDRSKRILPALLDTVNAMQLAADNEDRFGVVNKDLDFHRLLMEAAGYPHPIRVWQNITPVISRAFFIGTTLRNLQATVEEHQKLLNVMSSDDKEAAQITLKEHIEQMVFKFTLEQSSGDKHE